MSNQSTGFRRVANIRFASKYARIPTSCNVILGGASGNAGDIIEKITAVVENATVSLVTIQDGTANVQNVVVQNIGTRGTVSVDLGIASNNGAWTINTAAGVSVIVSGVFNG